MPFEEDPEQKQTGEEQRAGRGNRINLKPTNTREDGSRPHIQRADRFTP